MAEVISVLVEALEEGFYVFAVAFFLYFILSFFEGRVASFLGRPGAYGPAAGALLGAIPQCGISVVGADLYKKRHLTFGTLFALFLATSDEGLPVLFSSGDTILAGIAVLLIKMLAGLVFGYLIDLCLTKNRHSVHEHMEHCHGEEEKAVGCCGHHIGEEESALKEHLLHPLWHSFKMFLISFAVFFLFGLLMLYFEEPITNFLSSSTYLSPLYALVIGLIPNCASSVLLSSLYIQGALPFGALLCGLSVNSGLGILVLSSGGKENMKKAAIMLAALTIVSLALGYAFLFI